MNTDYDFYFKMPHCTLQSTVQTLMSIESALSAKIAKSKAQKNPNLFARHQLISKELEVARIALNDKSN